MLQRKSFRHCAALLNLHSSSAENSQCLDQAKELYEGNLSVKYQIRLTDRKGHGYFQYFDASSKEEARKKAPEVANDFLKKKRERYDLFYCLTFGFSPEKIHKRVVVQEQFEYEFSCFNHKTESSWCTSKVLPSNLNSDDWVKGTRKEWKKKRGGDSFKLQLIFVELGFSDGTKERNEWYELLEGSEKQNG